MTTEALSAVLVVALVLLGGLWVRGRLRLRRELVTSKTCARCGGTEWFRIHRRLAHHLFGLGLNIRRFRCTNPACGAEILFKR